MRGGVDEDISRDNDKERSRMMTSEDLIIPVYINEKIVLDMLAIMEDGFSMVSQINYSEHKDSSSEKQAGIGLSTSATILSKLLKIDFNSGISHTGANGESESVTKEKVHTNVSLLFKFRNYLKENKLLKNTPAGEEMKVGDFVEIEGELQKNPLINYMELFTDIFRMANIFTEEPELGKKTQAKVKKTKEQEMAKQMKDFLGELKQSGTIDFILSNSSRTIVLSAQERYLSNDNISEILGGRFKVLGKVIAVCADESGSIDLLRKTSLSILSESILNEMFSGMKSDEIQQFNLPELRTKIAGPAAIVIPVAIYA